VADALYREDYVKRLFVAQSVCVLVTNVKPAETDEPIEMSLGIGRQTHVCQMDRISWEGVLDVGGKC